MITNWIKSHMRKSLPQVPQPPLALKLEPGEHVYILLANRSTVSIRDAEQLIWCLGEKRIKVVLSLVDDPTKDYSLLELIPKEAQ